MSLCITELGFAAGADQNDAAWERLLTHVPEGTQLLVPRGRFRIGTSGRLTKRLHLAGVGPDSVLEILVGADEDGLALGDEAFDLQGLVWRDLCVYGARCRDTLAMTRVHRSRFLNVWVSGGDRYSAHLRGCLSNHLNLKMSVNVDLGGLVPRPGLMGGVRVGPPVEHGHERIASNANQLDLLIEGGRYESGATAQLFGEPQAGQGNNSVTGTIEGTTSGPSIELFRWAGASLRDLHVEESQGVRLVGCQSVVVSGGRFYGLAGQDIPALQLEGCVQTVLDRVHATRLRIDADSRLTELRTIRTDRLEDLSRSTSHTGATRWISEERLHVGPPGPALNWLRNGDFADAAWPGGMPLAYRAIGTGVVAERTGHGLPDPTRRWTRHACRIEVPTPGNGIATLPVLAVGGEDGIGFSPGIGHGFVAVRVQILLPRYTGPTDGVRLAVWIDDGAQVLLPSLVVEQDRWVEVAGAFPFEGERFEVQVTGTGQGVFYLAELMAAPGTGLPRTWAPRRLDG